MASGPRLNSKLESKDNPFLFFMATNGDRATCLPEVNFIWIVKGWEESLMEINAGFLRRFRGGS